MRFFWKTGALAETQLQILQNPRWNTGLEGIKMIKKYKDFDWVLLGAAVAIFIAGLLFLFPDWEYGHI